ncbi:hypothetical protein Tco_0678974 [Tanacetum coccineum]|uniref:Uncharacterized protein n=1 Tax=Tanacetum coccineum TaxID=301880 RepID=A0ABQ4XGJ8_9ASTR
MKLHFFYPEHNKSDYYKVVFDFISKCEWKEVMDACPKRNRAGWSTFYSQIRKRLDSLHKTEAKLELDFSKPLDELDPIIKLNILARKKKKNADDLHDYFKSTKRYKRSVQFVDHQAGTVLNEPSLGMILFNSSQRKEFISIEDFEVLNNEMLYNVYEIFFRLHKGSRINDLARTFSTFLVAKVEKRNLNLDKQMRLIEQLRHNEFKSAEDSSASVLQALRRSTSIFTLVYVAVQKLKKALARASVQLGWQCQAERCRSPLRS